MLFSITIPSLTDNVYNCRAMMGKKPYPFINWKRKFHITETPILQNQFDWHVPVTSYCNCHAYSLPIVFGRLRPRRKSLCDQNYSSTFSAIVVSSLTNLLSVVCRNVSSILLNVSLTESYCHYAVKLESLWRGQPQILLVAETWPPQIQFLETGTLLRTHINWNSSSDTGRYEENDPNHV